ncbi:unnamed protein product [Didymodactylos carnosus]|uniref:Uncharacterized protein n=1 Tax=Didymodactylos carnosus TaxID=1234261 RepID=A0A816ACW0_9BILA|nr:unnamed protein product [Didymodactylos carnosus]CAF1594399.1 unnamed protein product [Didymodactylos carnosus]CAF4295453.1 unnamed protein product [Didymodactylos carnosus]CAF4468051.1 unnamed protein product [Didymodactylos carnosus]
MVMLLTLLASVNGRNLATSDHDDDLDLLERILIRKRESCACGMNCPGNVKCPHASACGYYGPGVGWKCTGSTNYN